VTLRWRWLAAGLLAYLLMLVISFPAGRVNARLTLQAPKP